MSETGGIMQTWTYEEITKATEETITDTTKEIARIGSDHVFHRGTAHGAYALWAYLTYRKHPDWDADNERLKQLMPSVR
jgi:hypothetical protein